MLRSLHYNLVFKYNNKALMRLDFIILRFLWCWKCIKRKNYYLAFNYIKTIPKIILG